MSCFCTEDLHLSAPQDCHIIAASGAATPIVVPRGMSNFDQGCEQYGIVRQIPHDIMK
jgi:hypothetical protein